MNLERIYNKLIAAAVKENGRPSRIGDTKPGFENHHIKAKCLGGTDHKSNLVRLTCRQHYTAHHLLARYIGGALVSAWFFMSHDKTNSAKAMRITSRQYETAKMLLIEWQTGRTLTAEHRAKISAAGIGRKHTEEAKKKISNGHKGKKKDPVAVEKSAAKHRGKKQPKGIEDNQVIIKVGVNIITKVQIAVFGLSHAKELGLDSRKITKCINGKDRMKTHGGFEWRYATPEEEKFYREENNKGA